MKRYDFVSDNATGLCPESLAALNEANAGAIASYGSDDYTQRACDAIRALFGRPCEIFFVSTGTAANALALAHLCRPQNSVICHQTAHIETSECGAPEFFGNGLKLLKAPGENGKIAPEILAWVVANQPPIRTPIPRVLSLTLPTELGTVYSLEELGALRDAAWAHGLRIQLDGARFANAVASLDCEPNHIIEVSGADVLCFGGTKGGWSLSEAVVFFNLELATEFDYRCKQAGQLASKMRFLSAGWAAMLENGHWLRYARLANERAQSLAAKLSARGLAPSLPVQANAVFVPLPTQVVARLRAVGWQCIDFPGGNVRLMCSWQTSESTIDALIADLERALEPAI